MNETASHASANAVPATRHSFDYRVDYPGGHNDDRVDIDADNHSAGADGG